MADEARPQPDSIEDHLSASFHEWAASATRSTPEAPNETVLLTHYRLEYDTKPAQVPTQDSDVSVSPISKRELRRATRRANRRASSNAAAGVSASLTSSISDVEDPLASWERSTVLPSASANTVLVAPESVSEITPPALEETFDALGTAPSYEEWASDEISVDTTLSEVGSEATPPPKRLLRKFSNVLLLLACCLVTFGIVVLRSSGSTLPPTTPPPTPSTIPALSLSGAGWQAPEASLSLQAFMPSVAALRTQVSSLLEISSEGPLPLDQSVDAASAVLYPGVIAGFSRSFANPSEPSALILTALSYDSASSAETAVHNLAAQLGTTYLTYRAPSLPGLSLPQGDDLVLATLTESGEGSSTVVLRRQQVLFIATSRVSLASALAAVAASNALVSQTMTPRDSSIGALRPWAPSGTLDVSRPPLAPSEPLFNLQYPITGSDLCVGRDDLGVWSKTRCNFRTTLPFDPSLQSSVLASTSLPSSTTPATPGAASSLAPALTPAP